MPDSVAACECALESGELYGEVPDGRAFNDSAGKRQASCFRRQPIQKRVEAPTAHNVDPFELSPGEPGHITQDLAIAMREAMEDKTREEQGEKPHRPEWPVSLAPEAAG